jgi:hypothetical protein
MPAVSSGARPNSAPAADARPARPPVTDRSAVQRRQGEGLPGSAPDQDRDPRRQSSPSLYVPGPGQDSEGFVMGRNCDSCGAPYFTRSPLSRYCSPRCAKRAQRTGLARSAQGAAMIAEPPAVTQEVEAAVRATLEDAGRLSTPLGQVALALARRLDSPSGDTGAGLAALAKQLAATLAAVTADVRPADDLLDELRARRDRKLGRPEERR